MKTHFRPVDLALISDGMIQIPAGIVDMRDDRMKEQWLVPIESFYLAKFPVTQDLYFSVTGQNPSAFLGEKLPVETVSWQEAVIFCNRLSELLKRTPCYSLYPEAESITFNAQADGFRLPTEAEWQFACQANVKQVRYGEINDMAWYKENAHRQTQPVGRKQPNPWGLYDMLGNVWEWCTDIYDETVYGSYRIFRGGGWCDEERSVMATTRRRSHPGAFKIDDLGFRIAANLDF
ncbi:formylglycine-generating enzyme family protein [Adhaeribacter pallidiroseus]|uniref:Non-specific serine/threonine protein kinase n=1 Tax=Adhaeribacter pallidiroseus TaxID=2072847 RepID=A0A369QCK6_9BACT|nr:SUMF1/EgtB/PvdO family nonheme iron enzyme [Adhaeribacter pallidiroseus]RDC62172.1 Non-specific serine/threonine protein kinase [Adhaeribacter pallidiroseus]